jgi:RNA polymerase sigma-70 factor (ECF subfamily)
VAEPSRNNAEFRSLFDGYFDAITRYCLRRLPQDMAHDAAANVFVVAWRKIDQMPAGDQALPWLYGVARNEVRSIRRSIRRSLALRAKLNGQPRYADPGPEAVVVRNAEQAEVVRAFATLRPQDQEVLRLQAYEGLAIDQIATVLGCTPAAAKKRCSRAMRRLREAADTPGRRRMPIPPRAIHGGGDG